MKHGDQITIVLKHPHNVGLMLPGAKDAQVGRLVHTTVFIWSHHRRSNVRGTFEANHDDRIEHKLSDLGVTWLPGHVPFDSPEALELVRFAEEADKSQTCGTCGGELEFTHETDGRVPCPECRRPPSPETNK
jgi:hypothetical protein